MRSRIAWLGLPPTQALRAAFEDRNLAVVWPSADLAFETSHCLVVAELPDKRSLFARHLSDYTRAIDYGLKVVLLATSRSGHLYLQELVERTSGLRSLARDPDPPLVVRYLDTASAIAEEVARFDSGPPPTNVQLRGEFDPKYEVLLKRAFADCESVQLSPLEGGRSGSCFVGHAVLQADERPGRRPLPFFVKLDRREKIRAELRNYSRFVEGLIPFKNRPNLATGRSWLGASAGVLVGTFVEDSEGLAVAIRRRTDDRAIYSVFEEALRGWRLQAFLPGTYAASMSEDQAPTLLDSIASTRPLGATPRAFNPDAVKPQFLELARTLGATQTPGELHEKLASLPAIGHRRAPSHRDLHVKNVRVHGGTAIVLDFFAADDGPLLLDPATLEVSIAFTCCELADLRETGAQEAWRDVVDRLYQPGAAPVPPPAPSGTPFIALWDAVRRIRALGVTAEADARVYPVMLAVALVRAACHSHEDDCDIFRRAYGLVLAERLLGSL